MMLTTLKCFDFFPFTINTKEIVEKYAYSELYQYIIVMLFMYGGG